MKTKCPPSCHKHAQEEACSCLCGGVNHAVPPKVRTWGLGLKHRAFMTPDGQWFLWCSPVTGLWHFMKDDESEDLFGRAAAYNAWEGIPGARYLSSAGTYHTKRDVMAHIQTIVDLHRKWAQEREYKLADTEANAA